MSQFKQSFSPMFFLPEVIFDADEYYELAVNCEMSALLIAESSPNGAIEYYKEAIDYYKLAAKSGHAGAELKLAIFYEEGKYTSKSEVLASYFGYRAKRHGNDRSDKFLNDLAKKYPNLAFTKRPIYITFNHNNSARVLNYSSPGITQCVVPS